MAKTPEGKVKDKARKILDRHGAYYFMPVTGGFGVSGLFDEVVCLFGVFVGIEYKATAKDEPTPLQIQNALRCIEAGGVALLIHKDNLDVLDSVLTKIKTGLMPYEVRAELDKLCSWPYTEIPKVEL